MKEQLTTAQKQNKKYKKYDPYPPSPHQNSNINEPPPNLPILLIICSKNTMILISLAQMGQSNGCESVRNDEIFNLYLGSGVDGNIQFLAV